MEPVHLLGAAEAPGHPTLHGAHPLSIPPFRALSRASGPLYRCLSVALSAPLFRESSAALFRIPESAARVRGLRQFDGAHVTVLCGPT
jgi:hypothetical protein